MKNNLSGFLGEMFEIWRQNSSKIAVSETVNNNITYGELIRMTAWYQRRLTETSAKKAAILLPPGASAYAAEIACAARGVCFSPVHLAQPLERQKRMLQVFQPDIILGVPELALQMNLETNTPFVIPGKSEQQLTLADDNEESLVYVMFTSGSTGTPKGVRITRKGLAAFLNWSRDFYAVTPQDVWGQYSHMGFDLSICDVFTALHGGACLIPFADKSHRLLPARVIQSKGITIWHSVPTAFKFMREAGELVPSLLSSLRLISFCGEILRPDLVEDIFKAVPNVIIVNTYGPTETTVFCSVCRFDKASWSKHCQGNISIGTPLEGWHFHLQGSEGDEELVISGDLIGHGYEGAVDQGGYCTLKGRPAYRTGDYVKCIDDAYYFIGRRDRQIKIHGNRIELDEIDRALSGLGVLDTATLFQYNQICSFIVIRAPATVESVRTAAVQRLPAYAVPHRIEILPSLPKNANGKTDFPTLAKRIIELNAIN